MMMHYTELRKINVNDYIERKNGLAYLSWSWAVDQLLQLDESASWEYAEPRIFGETMMVFCTVHAFGKSRTAQLPVMDFRNKAIHNPDAFSVNTAMQRCLAKAISLHGLGMYIYAGEDLPMSEMKETKEEEQEINKAKEIKAPRDSITPTAGALEEFNNDEKDLLAKIAEEVTELVQLEELRLAHERCEMLENDEKVGLWSLLDSRTRSALKKYKKV
ncbi:DUF1071 domain-containing protein [Candidatus Methylopumilus turicensis]|uniref:SSAP RNA binding domain-containing protein n=1 Tax=Candidatus Methylopumilus turicensis TaxID=1581680 RepID=A0A0B7IXG6_9PROT|nr:DUF1071 domain-containing protein [Candidatus Methylopumilus turicensis]CEN55116.1 protein of unknown function [Candidatus Methylopumilus turicensis]